MCCISRVQLCSESRQAAVTCLLAGLINRVRHLVVLTIAWAATSHAFRGDTQTLLKRLLITKSEALTTQHIMSVFYEPERHRPSHNHLSRLPELCVATAGLLMPTIIRRQSPLPCAPPHYLMAWLLQFPHMLMGNLSLPSHACTAPHAWLSITTCLYLITPILVPNVLPTAPAIMPTHSLGQVLTALGCLPDLFTLAAANI